MSDPTQIGRYQVLGRLGQGAMGVVYRGVDASLDRQVALKVMAAGRGADTASRERFQREARAAARLQHPNIVTIYELGEHDGAQFMALELLEGVDLQRAIEAGMRPDPKTTLPIVLQLLAGLGHAHEHGIVHRDVKPSNLFLPRGRPAKIMDFGVARLGGGVTSTGVVGTPNYMSPEQVRGAPLDGRSDLFSAGLILYELVTGEKAYQGDSVVALLYKIAHESPNLRLIPSGPQWQRLREVLARALAKEPDARYPDAATMADDLTLALHDLGGSADGALASDRGLMTRTPQRAHHPGFAETVSQPAVVLPETAPAPVSEPLPPASAAPPQAAAPRPWLPIAIGGTAGLILVAVAAALIRPPAPQPTPPTTLAVPTPPPNPITHLSPGPGEQRPPDDGNPTPLRPSHVSTPPPPSTTLRAAATPAPLPSPRDTVSTDARLDRANDLMEKQNYQAALAEARAVLAREPGNAAAKAMVEDAEAGLVVETRIKNAREAIKRGNRERALEEVKAGLAVNASDSRLIALFRELTQ